MKSRSEPAGIDTCSYIPPVPEACCWSWSKRCADSNDATNLDGARSGLKMLLLAADTSGKHGSIALALCGPETACSVIEVVPLAGGTFSAQLVPLIAALLAKHGHTKQHIDAFSVVSGPGSFTGLRIGLAAIKALAEVLAKPVAAVSMLEAMALSGRSWGKVIAAMDAGRGDVYAGEYHVS